MSSAVTQISVRIYAEDTDLQGIVYHANYLRYMERARTEMMRDLGFTKPAVAGGVNMVVTKIALDYRRPAGLDDLLTVTSQLETIRASTLQIAQRVERDGELLVEATITAACLSAESQRPVRIPAPMREALSTLLLP
jgi:tol-pal system-associated acyl-CoA thioesterase